MDFTLTLRKSATQFASRTAVVCGDQRITYAELYERSCRLANALIGLGLERGDRIATLEDNLPETLDEICGMAIANLVRCPMYTQNPVDVHIYMLNLTGAKALIIQDTYWKELAARIGEATTVEHVIVH